MSRVWCGTEGRGWETVTDVEAAVLNGSSGVDLGMVLACRRLVRRFLIDNQDRLFNQLSLRDSILFSYPDVT